MPNPLYTHNHLAIWLFCLITCRFVVTVFYRFDTLYYSFMSVCLRIICFLKRQTELFQLITST